MTLISLLTVQCHSFVPEGPPSSQNIEDFEIAWDHINTHYPLFEFKNIDWDAIYIEYRAKAESAVGDEIFIVLSDLVGELQDGHATVVTLGGLKVRPYTPPRRLRDRDKVDANILRTYFDRPLRVVANESIEFELITDSIGYVRISTFGNRLSGNQGEFANVVSYFKHTTGLIIDIRENDGGSGSVVNSITSHLISQTVSSGYQLKRNEVLEFASVDPHPGIRYEGRIVMLINGSSFSAAETFADKLRGLPNVTLLGDTTAGGGVGNNGDPFVQLPGGFGISINDCAILRKDSVFLEWNGVPPDVLVEQSKSSIQNGIDAQLEAAIRLLGD